MAASTRQLSLLDKIIIEADIAARTLLGTVQAARDNPADLVHTETLTTC